LFIQDEGIFIDTLFTNALTDRSEGLAYRAYLSYGRLSSRREKEGNVIWE
jgi:hypothetical protein